MDYPIKGKLHFKLKNIRTSILSTNAELLKLFYELLDSVLGISTKQKATFVITNELIGMFGLLHKFCLNAEIYAFSHNQQFCEKDENR